jgi:ABC-type antimicrobial peptide transport system permease subunit
LDKPDDGTVYWPMPGRGVTSIDAAITHFRNIVLRTKAAPEAALPSVRQIVRDLDPTLPFSNAATIDDLVEQSLQRPRSLSFLVGGFAIVALLLSIIGIYGVMAYYVQQHAKDISIRLALGGSQGNVLRLIVGQGMTVVAAGVAIGVAGATLLGRLMSSLLFGVGAGDPLTFVGVTALLLGVALAACYLPAGRAVAVEPAAVLRNE